MAQKTSAAYDFDLFQTQPLPKKKQKPAPKLKVVKQRESIKSRNSTLKAVGCVLVFFVGVVGILVSQIALTEVTKQVSDATTELNNAQSEYRILQTEMESSAALSNIESTVTRQLGMSKLRNDQVTYVIPKDKKIQDETPEELSLWERVQEAFGKLLEYLKPAENTME